MKPDPSRQDDEDKKKNSKEKKGQKESDKAPEERSKVSLFAIQIVTKVVDATTTNN